MSQEDDVLSLRAMETAKIESSKQAGGIVDQKEKIPGINYGSEAFCITICSRGDPNFVMAVQNNVVALARRDPNDNSQRWDLNYDYARGAKDSEGQIAFALTSMHTGQAIKAVEAPKGTHKFVELADFDPTGYDESLLWTRATPIPGEYYWAIRRRNDTSMNMDAYGAKIAQGTRIILWEWLNGKNQKWKFHLCCKFSTEYEHLQC